MQPSSFKILRYIDLFSDFSFTTSFITTTWTSFTLTGRSMEPARACGKWKWLPPADQWRHFRDVSGSAIDRSVDIVHCWQKRRQHQQTFRRTSKSFCCCLVKVRQTFYGDSTFLFIFVPTSVTVYDICSSCFGCGYVAKNNSFLRKDILTRSKPTSNGILTSRCCIVSVIVMVYNKVSYGVRIIRQNKFSKKRLKIRRVHYWDVS